MRNLVDYFNLGRTQIVFTLFIIVARDEGIDEVVGFYFITSAIRFLSAQ